MNLQRGRTDPDCALNFGFACLEGRYWPSRRIRASLQMPFQCRKDRSSRCASLHDDFHVISARAFEVVDRIAISLQGFSKFAGLQPERFGLGSATTNRDRQFRWREMVNGAHGAGRSDVQVEPAVWLFVEERQKIVKSGDKRERGDSLGRGSRGHHCCKMRPGGIADEMDLGRVDPVGIGIGDDPIQRGLCVLHDVR